MGKRHKVNVTPAQASGPGSTATADAPTVPESDFWTWRKVGAFIVGLAGIAGAVFAAIEAL